jgi:para-nitrobenzyl esterase
MGIFSYMVVPEMEEGNFGMKDNVAALQFVHANAEALGGDPDRITIMGESWGGTTTFLLTVIESAWPYYQRVISQSPLAYIYPNRTQVEEYSLQWAAAAGCNASVVPSVLDCLHNLTAEELYDNVAASQALIENRFIPYYGDPFLPIHPLVAMRDGLTKPDIEGMIVGASGNEGVSMAYWFGGGAREESQLNFPIYSMAFFPVPWYGTEEDKNAVIDFYTNGNTSLTPQEYYDALVRSAGVGFYCQIQYMMEAYPQDNDTRVYRYWFRHRSAFTVIPGNDSFHVGEIPYLFPDLVGPLRMYDGYNHTDRFVSEEMRNWWGNFARRNSPNSTPNPLPGRDWPRYRLHNKRTLNIKYTYWGFPYEILSGEHSPQECDSLLRDIYFP